MKLVWGLEKITLQALPSLSQGAFPQLHSYTPSLLAPTIASSSAPPCHVILPGSHRRF